MPKSGLFFEAALACVLTAALQAPAVASPRQPAADVDSAGARQAATNQALLTALRQRRAEIARLPDAEHRQYALAFLDRQIDRVTNQALLDALRQRRDELVRTMADDEHKRYALDFLDRQIESVRRDLGD